jgi:hypothetical protein
MQHRTWLAAVGAALTLSLSAQAEISEGVMSIRGAEMS